MTSTVDSSTTTSAGHGGLIALTFLLLAALFLLLYCLLRQVGATKLGLRRMCAFLFGRSGGASRAGAGGPVSGLGEEDEAEEDYTNSRRTTNAANVGGGGGLFWKTSDEERSILGVASRAGSTRSTNSAALANASSSTIPKDYSFLQQEQQMATITANSGTKLPPSTVVVTNGISSSKSQHSNTNLTHSSSSIVKGAVSPTVASTPPDYTYSIIPPPPPSPSASVTSSPSGSRRRRPQPPPPSIMDNQQRKKSTEKSPLLTFVDSSSSSTTNTGTLLRATTNQQQQPHEPIGNSRPATPDFRYTVFGEEDNHDGDESRRKSSDKPSGGYGSLGGSAVITTNGNNAALRSVSVDGSGRGGAGASAGGGTQLSTTKTLTGDQSAGNEPRRHSLTTTSAGGVVTSTSNVDNTSPSGSVSDFDPESLLVLDDSFSCSRRTSISSVDSNLERLDETSAPSLMRALSSDSLDSNCSIMELSNNEPEIGQLEARLYYDSASQYLQVWISQAYDIKPVTSSITSSSSTTSNIGGLVEYWVVVFLLPHQKPLYRTQLLPYAPVLQFHEQFRQRVRDQDLRKLALLCQLYCRVRPPHDAQSVGAALAAAGATPPLHSSASATSSMTPVKRSSSSSITGGNELIGQAKVRLKDVELSVANTLWLALLPRLDSSGDDQHLGEMLFSLSYLPTAERLTVVVAKARNIRTEDGVAPEKIMVRVYLVYGAKISKKKTSIKSTVEGSANFNESIIFSLSQTLVQKVYLRLSMVEPPSMKGGDQRTLGHVTVGSRRTAKEFGHWQKMIEQPRKPVSMWHHLAPKSQKLT